MTVIVLDADAVIRHGRSFSSRTRAAVDRDETIVLPNSVKQELVDDVLDGDPSDNHRRSAETIQGLIDDGVIEVTNPDFEKFSDVIDEARRRIANDSLPEHHVEADQYIPAVVCELANEQSVQFVTGDTKLQAVVRDISEAQGFLRMSRSTNRLQSSKSSRRGEAVSAASYVVEHLVPSYSI